MGELVQEGDKIWSDVLDVYKGTYLRTYMPGVVEVMDSAREPLEKVKDAIELAALARANVGNNKLPPIEDDLPAVTYEATHLLAGYAVDPFQLESIVRVGAAILERAAIDRAAWQRLNADCFKIALDLVEFWCLDLVHQEEEKNHYHEQGEKDAAAEAEALQISYDHLNPGWVAMLNFEAGFYTEEAKAKRRAWARDAAALPMVNDPSRERVDVLEGQLHSGKALIDFARDRAQEEFDVAIAREITQFLLQRAQVDSNQQATSRRLQRAYERQDYERHETGCSERRSKVRRMLARTRAKAFSDSDGALNLLEQMEVIKRRYPSDLSAARGYAAAMRDGLKRTRDLTVDEPPERLDGLVGWVRSVANLVDRLAISDVSACIRLSVRAKGGAPIDAATTSVWKVRLNDDDIAGLTNVRIMGVEAFLEMDGPGRTFAMRIAPGELPEYRLGCVGPANWPRQQVMAVSWWLNRDPRAEWTLELISGQLAEPDLDQIRDVVVNVWVSARRA